MPANEFLVLWLSSWAAIAFFRIAPAFALRGRTLSPRITEALGYIPPAAFAALVANVAAIIYIAYRAKKLGRNPYKQDVFEGTSDWEKATARRAKVDYAHAE